MYVYLGKAVGLGLLISGDDRGNIWLYNVEDFVKSPHVCDEPLKPSRVSDGW